MFEMVISEKSHHQWILPTSCVQHIVSHLSYHNVSQLREVSKSFDVACKNVLNKGYDRFKGKMMRELKCVEAHGPVPSLQRTSFRKFHFLSDTYDALRDCRRIYRFYMGDDRSYFVAGKVLDEAYRLWEHFSSRTTIPFVKDALLLQKPHPLLEHFFKLTARASHHFENNVVAAFILVDQNYPFYEFMEEFAIGPLGDLLHQKINRQFLKMLYIKDLKKKVEKQEKIILIGKQTNRQYLNVILRLNEVVINLSQKTAEVDAKLANLTDQLMTFSVEGCFKDLSFSLPSKLNKTLRASSVISDRKKPNFGTFPSNCLQHIFSYLNYEKLSQMRRVCKNFDESCKNALNNGFQMLKTKVDIEENHLITKQCFFSLYKIKFINICNDLRILMLYCEDTYKMYLDGDFYFSAGKVLDEIRVLFNSYRSSVRKRVWKNAQRPHPHLFPLMELIYKAINHFQNKFAPKYYPRKCRPRYTPDFATSRYVTTVNIGFEKRIILNFETMENRMYEQIEMIEKQKNRRRNFLKVISKLKKSLEFHNHEVSDKMKRLIELEQQWLTRIPVKLNQKFT